MLSMAESKSVSAAQKKQEAARVWLSYYNRVLYEKGIITLTTDRWTLPSHLL